MKEAWIKKHRVPLIASAAFVVFAAVFFSRIVAWFSGEEMSKRPSEQVRTMVGELAIELAIEPDPPRAGKNTIVIGLRRGGEPVSGAAVSVEVWMPAMGSMPEMRSVADVSESSPGVYRAQFHLSMGGSWTASVKVVSEDDSISTDYGLTVGTPGLRSGAAMAGTRSTSGSMSAEAVAHEFSEDGRVAVLAALDAYESIRAGLANDSVAEIRPASEVLAAALSKAMRAELGAPEDIRNHLMSARESALALAKHDTPESARVGFSSLSEHLVPITSSDPALMEGRHAFECPMWDGFGKWIQPSDELANPYMGQAMPTCGSEQSWQAAGRATPANEMDHQHDPDDVSHYTCSMHPWVKKDSGEETCPVCSMDLTAVTKEEVSEGTIRIDRDRRQAFGIRTQEIGRRLLTVPITAVGRIATDERRLADVSLKYDGFIEKLYVEETGGRVRKGQALFDVYSPELFAAQHELILASEQAKTAVTATQKERSASLLIGARKRMRLWDISKRQIDSIVTKGKPQRRISVRSPASGYILEKNVVEGAAVKTGARLYRIANLEKVWAEAELYEEQLPLVRVGQHATVKLTNVEKEKLSGEVSFVHPTIDPRSRTAKIRIELDNRELSLRPEMFVDVMLEVDYGEKLVVPEAAIVYSGPRRIVFVDVGQDRLRPTLVEVGVKSGGYAEVLSGLKQGDKVVVSGNFLVAAESRLKSSTGIW